MKVIFTEDNFKIGAMIMALIALVSLFIYAISIAFIGMFQEFGWLFIYALLALFVLIILIFLVGHLTHKFFGDSKD